MTWPFGQFMPPGARGKMKPDLMKAAGWHAEEKLDGDRRIAQFCPEGVRFTGRVISKKTGTLVEKTDNLPHLNPAVAHLVGTVLDGEMICDFPGARSRDVTSIMGSHPDVAIAKQKERGWVRYAVFDCLFAKGEDLRGFTLAERREIAAAVLKAWANPHAVLVPAVSDGREEFLAGIWDRGGEGIILKRLDSVYGDEKAWVKVKRELSFDVVVMGYDEPKEESVKVDGTRSITKYAAAGLIGAIRFGQYKDGVLTYCGSCSGFDDDLRLSMSKDRDGHLGKVFEITAQLREPSGHFRHPRFKGFRDNKMAEQCLWVEEQG